MIDHNSVSFVQEINEISFHIPCMLNYECNATYGTHVRVTTWFFGILSRNRILGTFITPEGLLGPNSVINGTMILLRYNIQKTG